MIMHRITTVLIISGLGAATIWSLILPPVKEIDFKSDSQQMKVMEKENQKMNRAETKTQTMNEIETETKLIEDNEGQVENTIEVISKFLFL